mmetsp:Transcript_35990/g.64337  ORF Transcript_35990/g.64337 Transcript_35990/m.64337 type:complete len:223 (+) Transcript_35990:238-906(+)
MLSTALRRLRPLSATSARAFNAPNSGRTHSAISPLHAFFTHALPARHASIPYIRPIPSLVIVPCAYLIVSYVFTNISNISTRSGASEPSLTGSATGRGSPGRVQQQQQQWRLFRRPSADAEPPRGGDGSGDGVAVGAERGGELGGAAGRRLWRACAPGGGLSGGAGGAGGEDAESGGGVHRQATIPAAARGGGGAGAGISTEKIINKYKKYVKIHKCHGARV